MSESHVQPCPSCGHCPTCGRGPQAVQYFYPWYVPQPWVQLYPWWMSGGASGGSIGTTGEYTISNYTGGNYAVNG